MSHGGVPALGCSTPPSSTADRRRRRGPAPTGTPSLRSSGLRNPGRPLLIAPSIRTWHRAEKRSNRSSSAAVPDGCVAGHTPDRLEAQWSEAQGKGAPGLVTWSREVGAGPTPLSNRLELRCRAVPSRGVGLQRDTKTLASSVAGSCRARTGNQRTFAAVPNSLQHMGLA